MDLREIGWKVVDCMHLSQDRDRWRAVVNTVMNVRVHKMRRISWLAEWLLAFHEGLCSMELVSVQNRCNYLVQTCLCNVRIKYFMNHTTKFCWIFSLHTWRRSWSLLSEVLFPPSVSQVFVSSILSLAPIRVSGISVWSVDGFIWQEAIKSQCYSSPCNINISQAVTVSCCKLGRTKLYFEKKNDISFF